MAKNYQPEPANPGMGKLIIMLLLMSVGGVLFYNYWKKERGNYTSIPQEIQLKYIPSDFHMDLDEDWALEVLSNPQRYRKEFNQLIYDLNTSILNHVATRMGLTDSLKQAVYLEYDKHHAYLRNLYYNDFITLKDTTSNLYQTWYENESTNATALLNEVASKYTCFLVNQILTTVIPTEGGSIYAKGMNVDTPCGVALTEALQPLIKRMEDRAAIRDFSRSRGLMQEKIERVIAELATMEVRDKKGLNKTLQTKVWGFSVSSTDIEISAISIIKVGFKLDEYFDVSLNSKTGIVTITLPEPTILSHEVYPKLDKLDIGWLREVKDADLNKAFNALRAEFRREALESDIMDKSKAQANELMNTMFSPVLASLNKKYQLKVEFRENPLETIPDQSDDFLVPVEN